MRGVLDEMSTVAGKYYWVRLRAGGRWEPAERVSADGCCGSLKSPTDTDDAWLVLAMDCHLYDSEVNEVGPELIPPPQ